MAKRKKLTPEQQTRALALVEDAQREVRQLIEFLQAKLAEKRSS